MDGRDEWDARGADGVVAHDGPDRGGGVPRFRGHRALSALVHSARECVHVCPVSGRLVGVEPERVVSGGVGGLEGRLVSGRFSPIGYRLCCGPSEGGDVVPRSCRSGTQGDISGPEGGEAPSRPAAANKGRRFPPETLTEVEVSALIRAASGRAPTGIRNRVLIVVLYRGGLRMFEALALGVRDVDVEAGTIACDLQALHAAVFVAGHATRCWPPPRRSTSSPGRGRTPKPSNYSPATRSCASSYRGP
jgi:Phage integrase family